MSSTPLQRQAAASGGGNPASNACALVSQQEATALLGSDPGPGIANASGDGSVTNCNYGTALHVIVEHRSDRGEFDDKRTIVKKLPSFQEVVGVGDAAYLDSEPYFADLYILKGSVFVTVGMLWDPTVKTNITSASLTALGKAIVGRL